MDRSAAIKSSLGAFVLGSTLALASTAGADIYAFVDSNGVRHISNVPNDPRYKLVMSTPRYASTSTPAAPEGAGSIQSPRFTRHVSAGTGWRIITPRNGAASVDISQFSISWARPSKPFAVNEDARTRYSAYIEQVARRHRLEPELLHAVVSAESSYNPQAVSRAGAMGLMQLMPDTARRFGVADPFDPLANLNGGAQYLRLLLDQFRSVNLALAAYNAGEGAVSRYGNTIPPFPETQTYVRRVISFYNHYRSVN